MERFAEAVLAGASGTELAPIPIPGPCRAALVRRDETEMFVGLLSTGKDPRRSSHMEEVATPELAPDECHVAVMAGSVSFNTVRSSIFEPLATSGFPEQLGREDHCRRRHDLPGHVVGSDAAGVVGAGPAVRNRHPGDKAAAHCNYVDPEDPQSHDDAMPASEERIWGYETNLGGLADLTVNRATQLMGRPAHLSWEEAAANTLCSSTSYRMLVGRSRARMRQGDVVLVWGATGGLGGHAVQHVLNGGGIPVGVVSSPANAKLLEALGCEAAIDRSAAACRFWSDEHIRDEAERRRLGRDIRSLVGDDPGIVLEHPGRQTMGAPVFVAKRGGTIVTCAASSGHMIEYDNRHLGTGLKTIKSSHLANCNEAWEADRLAACGRVRPSLSVVHPLSEVGEAAVQVHSDQHEGKAGVRCLAPENGLGTDGPSLREEIGEDKITVFRRTGR